MPPNPKRQNPSDAPSKGTKKSVIDRISGIDFSENTGMKMLLYGRPGTGKTTLAATFPSPILWVICSGAKKRSGELLSVDTEENRNRIKKVELYEPGELWEIAQYVHTSRKFKTIVLDHASGFQDLVMKEKLGLEDIPSQRSFGLATQNEWNQIAKDFKDAVGPLLDLDCNVIINAQEKIFKGDENNPSDIVKPFIGASLIPSVNNWLNFSVDYISQTLIRPKEEIVTIKVLKRIKDKEGKLVKKEVEQQRTRIVEGQFQYYLRTGISDNYQTKFRVTKDKVKPTFIADPTYEKIRAVIEGKG